MPQTFKVKNSVEAGKVPAAGDLATAELGLNLKDQKLYSKDAEGNVFEIGVCDWEDIKDNPITIDGTQPSLPEIGDLWVDLGECPPQLKIWSDCEDPGKPEWISIGGAAGKPGLITKQPTLTADNSGYAPCTLTATEGEATFATKVDEEWYLDGVEIGDGPAQTLLAATPGTYKYEEKWVGDDGNLLLASAEIVVSNLELAQPSVLTPPDGAGIGGDVTYTPETSAITGVVDVPGGWNAAAPTQDNAWLSVAYGSGRFVAVADFKSGTPNDNYIMHSPTGEDGTWTTSGLVVPDDINRSSVQFVNGKFLVGSNDQRLNGFLYSSDGLTWKSTASPAKTCVNFAYGNGLWVGMSGTTLLTSSDGETWIESSATGLNSGSKNGLAFGNNTFVTGASNGEIYYSSDGLNWTNITVGSEDWQSVTYANNKFVAVGRKGATAYSSNGSVWTVVDPISDNSWYSVTYGDGKFVAVSGNGTNRVMWSTDGISWTAASATEANSWNSVTYGGDKFVAVSNNGTDRVMWSTTGADPSTELTLTDSQTYNNADGSGMGQPISETFTAGQTVKGESTSGTYGALTPAFSTTLYSGNNATQTVETGIDNTTKALVWIKGTNQSFNHSLYDTERGKGSVLITNKTDAENAGFTPTIFDFASNGFTLSAGGDEINNNGLDNVAWNFRAAPGFLDIVTYPGNGVAGTTIPHNLGSVPGMMIIKDISATRDWAVYHKSLGATHWISINGTGSANDNDALFDDTEPTDSVFTVGWDTEVNRDGSTYVAYLFGSNDTNIKCGSYIGTGANQTIDCGFKPGWLMIKMASRDSSDTGGTNGQWFMVDNQRDEESARLYANKADAESTYTGNVAFEDNGFSLESNNDDFNDSHRNPEYIYIAIAENATAGQFQPTGELIADADAANSTITLTNTTGDWTEAGLKVVNDTEATKEAPGASGIVFTSSEPDTTEGTVTSWGMADWQLSTSSDFSTDLQEQSVSLTDSGVQTGPNFTLEDDTDYYVRAKYNSSDPVEVSEVSTANHFKTASPDAPDVKDVFSTTLYDGEDNVGRLIENGVDNTGKALVWIKGRNRDYSNMLIDTERGTRNTLYTNRTDKYASLESVTDFNSNGFTLGDDTEVNSDSAKTYVAWNFKAAPGFFDIQTWTGNGVAGRTMPHDLSSVPGMIIVKQTSNSASWFCYHQDLGNEYKIRLNSTDAASASTTWNNTSPTTTEFTLGEDGLNVNNNNEEYVGYLFADTPGLIKCGSMVGQAEFTVPFKIGWILFKAVNSGAGWRIQDSVRGIGNYGDSDPYLEPDTAAAEATTSFLGLVSTDGVNYTYKIDWGVGEMIYVAIADPTTTTYYDEVNSRAVSQHELVRRFGVDADSTNLRNQGIYPLVNQPTGATEAFVKEGHAYRAIPDRSMEVFHAQQEAEEANERLDDANEKLLKIQSDFEARLVKLEGKQTRGKKKDD